jgi:Acyclic terpene utilisation family protein AtuA
MPPPLRIANGAGFWGDSVDAPVQLAESGQVDVLTLEYLAELTLAILAHLRSKDPNAGYATDFTDVLPRLAPILHNPSFSIVTNAGGLNPPACAHKAASILTENGLGALPVAVITGDDLLPWISGFRREGVDLANTETGEAIDRVADQLVAANAYLGSAQIVEAIANRGARLLITGRVADASLTLGPAAAHYGWHQPEWDKLAGGSVAGHLIECGAQATGGLWHDWVHLEDLANIGYPIAEVHEDGSCVITKPAGTGGLVTVPNVAEQVVYEIDDPTCYRTPDVNVDLTTVRLSQVGQDRVRVEGATGSAPPGKLKVAAIYRDGWTTSAMIAVVGQHAEKKARRAGEVVIERLRRAGSAPYQHLIECLGAGDVVPGVLPRTEPLEVILRITVRDSNRAVIDRFCKEIAPLVTNGPSGVAGYASGRPSPRPAFGYWPTLIARELVPASLKVRQAKDW